MLRVIVECGKWLWASTEQSDFYRPTALSLNIVASAWSTWKAAFEQELAERRPQLLQQTHADRMAAMLDMGNRHLDVLTAEKCINWYRRTLTYINRLIREDDILQDHA